MPVRVGDHQINRRGFLQSLGACTAAATASCLAGEGTAGRGRRPNVVFILTDDQGYGPMHCHGDPYIKTPHMDRLHGESVRFTNFHVQPNCAPTRAMLLTGRPPLKNGVWATIRGRSLLRRGEVTIADAFRASGYKTAIFGKWHLGDNYPFRPQDRGFEEVLVHGGGGVGNIQDYWANNYFDDHYLHNGTWEKHPGYCTDVWFEKAMKFIETHRADPFFVYIPTNAPHLPLVVPERYTAQYAALPSQVKKNAAAIAAFYGMITNIDENLGRLRGKLSRLGLDRDTILVFMSDNGTTRQFALWNAHMSGGKGSVLEGGHRVPFFIHWPNGGLTDGRDIDALTTGMDLRPTLEELCKLKRPKGPQADGKSLAPLLRGEEPAWIDRTICLDLQKQQRTPAKANPHVVMRGRWRWTDGKLHDLTDDPGQRKDVKARHPDLAGQLRAEYDRWWEEMAARDFDAGHEIIIGSDHEDPCILTTHDISGEVAWNHDQVLAGARASGFWDVEVVRDGEYEFVLRRYPAEANAPIGGSIRVPERLRKFYYYARRYDYAVRHARSQPIPAARAALSIGPFRANKPIPPKADPASADYATNARGKVTGVKFRTELKVGKTRLEAWFEDNNGRHVTSAYYVQVMRR